MGLLLVGGLFRGEGVLGRTRPSSENPSRLVQGRRLDSGDLAAGNLSAFSPDEWMTLASYEARFGARRAVMYAYPTDAYGLTSTGGFDVSMKPITAATPSPVPSPSRPASDPVATSAATSTATATALRIR